MGLWTNCSGFWPLQETSGQKGPLGEPWEPAGCMGNTGLTPPQAACCHNPAIRLIKQLQELLKCNYRHLRSQRWGPRRLPGGVQALWRRELSAESFPYLKGVSFQTSETVWNRLPLPQPWGHFKALRTGESVQKGVKNKVEALHSLNFLKGYFFPFIEKEKSLSLNKVLDSFRARRSEPRPGGGTEGF